METGVKLMTLPALGPDGKRRPAAPAATARVDPGLILNGTNVALAADVSDEVIFSPDDPYWKLAPDARRKLRQRRIAIRGRFAQSPRAAPVSPRKNAPSGMALPLPHSAQQSLAGERSPGVLSPVPAEATVAAARRRAGVPLLRPLRSSGTICSSSAVGDALVAEPPAAAPLRNAFSGTEPAPPAESERIPWGRFFASRSFWAIAGAHFCSNWGWNSFMAWLPTYFTQKLGLDLAASSTITLIPWTMAFLAGNTSGMLADWMSGTGMHKTKVRAIPVDRFLAMREAVCCRRRCWAECVFDVNVVGIIGENGDVSDECERGRLVRFLLFQRQLTCTVGGARAIRLELGRQLLEGQSHDSALRLQPRNLTASLLQSTKPDSLKMLFQLRSCWKTLDCASMAYLMLERNRKRLVVS
jgi:hypothetical protein